MDEPGFELQRFHLAARLDVAEPVVGELRFELGESVPEGDLVGA